MKAFLLAAGLGKRMLQLTENKPKCLLEAGGKSLLKWNVERLKSFGYDDLVINLHHEGDQIVDFLKDGSHLGVKVEYIHEEELLGTGGAIGNALKVLGEDPFLLLSSDIWTDFDFSTFAISSDKLAHLVLIENPENNIGGDMFFENKDGFHFKSIDSLISPKSSTKDLEQEEDNSTLKKFQQAKYVNVLKGRILDVAIDLRKKI